MPQLSVIVPAFNERDNLAPLTAALASTLDGIDYEVVVVDDDSPDGTGALARRLAQDNPRIRVIQRIGRRGLASAVVEGALSTSSPYIAVIDADLQHDERILPAMLAKLRADGLDLVVGSRHTGEGGMGDLSSDRVKLSNAGRRLFHAISHTHISDPMSGYFVLTRGFFDEVAHSLSAIGFKVLVDLLASARRPVRVGEVGYQFRSRAHGDSKLDIVVELEYLELLFDKLTGGWIPPTYFLFGLVGTAGMFFNFVAAALLLRVWGVDFFRAQAIGALLTVALNFFLNNALTFRSARMRGAEIVTGLLLFYVVCSIALLAQLAVASALRQFGVHWAPATLVGIVIGSVWNYTIAAQLVWRGHRRRAT
ncbi:MAG: glycosyltransferase family 2 protein [Vicinamibacteria bacterium]|nr:glycosyltransferase family 2 protein [Vicinamibacteria bacterium]